MTSSKIIDQRDFEKKMNLKMECEERSSPGPSQLRFVPGIPIADPPNPPPSLLTALPAVLIICSLSLKKLKYSKFVFRCVSHHLTPVFLYCINKMLHIPASWFSATLFVERKLKPKTATFQKFFFFQKKILLILMLHNNMKWNTYSG